MQSLDDLQEGSAQVQGSAESREEYAVGGTGTCRPDKTGAVLGLGIGRIWAGELHNGLTALVSMLQGRHQSKRQHILISTCLNGMEP